MSGIGMLRTGAAVIACAKLTAMAMNHVAPISQSGGAVPLFDAAGAE
jgi:hypothetical protein